MMQQGGVSKATKTVNLSEDIFAGESRDALTLTLTVPVMTSTPRPGMDFTLRGNGRTIKFLSINLAHTFFT